MRHALSGMEATLGKDRLDQIKACKILLVGAGGIGCELLKNLALSGFQHVEVIDLDTIDVSNLNRQLLFRSQHVGMPKCTVACQVATELVSDPSKVTFLAHHGNVCDNSTFHVQFVKQFDLTLNALDNVTARRRVNRLCLAAGVPLIEAGTTGYNGQVAVIDKESNLPCYECKAIEPPKVYPICTIRSTPSMPVHTIVWSKELYKLLFSEKVEESMLYEDGSTSENAEEGSSTYMEAVQEFRKIMARALQEQQAAAKAASSTAKPVGDEMTASIVEATKQLVTVLYAAEIQKQLDMDRYKTARKRPVVLETSTIAAGCTPGKIKASNHLSTTAVWSKEECIAALGACLLQAVSDPAVVLPSFDKDDDLSMKFVTATSNLRSYVFGIEPIQSYYNAKGIAGNIIPAIATTNAIVAGLQILQAFHVLEAQLKHKEKAGNLRETCSYVNCVRNATRNGLYLTATRHDLPNHQCFVCKKATLSLTLNVNNWTLEDLLNKVIKKDLGFEQPTILLDGGDCIWEEGDSADSASFASNLSKKLPQLPCGGIKYGAMVTIEDFSQDLTVDVNVTHQETWPKTKDDDGNEIEDDNEFKFVVSGNKPQAKEEDAKMPASKETGGDPEDDDDDDIVVVSAASAAAAKEDDDKKRPANGDAKGEPAKKKAKTAIPSNQEVIEID